MKKQIHALFSGRVQGVGFRFTSRGLAEELKLTGWVKNLPDGGVEVLAEAEEAALQDFLCRIGNAFSSYIKDAQVRWLPATGEYRDFRIEL
jgi:acylphosphatase